MTYTGITGFVPGPSPANQQGIGCASNLDLSGIQPPGQVGNCYKADGQLWIGSTALTAGGTNSRIGNITSTDGSINVINGSGTIDIRGSAQGFQPNAVIQIFDDFLVNGGAGFGQLSWDAVTGGGAGSATPVQLATTSSNHPGIVQMSNGDSNVIVLTNSSPFGNFILGGGTLSFSFVIDLVTLSVAGNRYTARIGMTDDLLGLFAVVNGIYFTYSDNVNSGNWVLNCTSASVSSSVNSTIAATTGFHTFTINVNAAASSITFLIDNVSAGAAITTNIPTVAISPYFALNRSSGALAHSQLDLFWLTQTLSNPRVGPTNPAVQPVPSGRLLENYTQTGTNYQVLGTDAIIGVSNTAAPRTITMPSASVTAGQRWTITDESGGAAAHNITVNGNGFNIDGAATYVINTNFGSVDLYFNGSAYFVL